MSFSNLNQAVNRALSSILIFFMGAMVVTVVWQVFTRFVTNDPSVFTDELSRYLLIWIGILGGAYTYAVKRHLALELLMPHLSFTKQQVLCIFINLLIVAFSSITFVYGGSAYVLNTLEHQQVSPGLSIAGHQLLIGYVYAVVPIAGLLINYYGVLDISDSFVKILTAKKGSK
ncbi:TRAP transporter small permease [Alginatibacterium sediminis]|uniref:TRAP transporter small permease protein n=1 Tax=Alginatibacterium sediminis TaxID=2164068 RepID=A0A420EB64_9ALTE|nr:TRAP transporter small permease [Alginatibacterium sediminis]RKF17882.1 TRAP transporter small permease [Alginatibacterium sediminis]